MKPRGGVFRLPWALQRHLETSAQMLLSPAGTPHFNFSLPRGEPALVAHDSVAWRIFKNPIALLVGGLAAVVLELAEPSVRAGVWEHSAFRHDPFQRMRRTGLAAMVTIYGARSLATSMIERVARLHARVSGSTQEGLVYSARDPRLLSWVQATATFGFAESYGRFVSSLSRDELDGFYRESLPVSALYGATQAPASAAEQRAFFEAMHPRLEATPAIFEFLTIMQTVPGFPAPIRWMQGPLVRAAVDLVPSPIRARLGLTELYGPRSGERWLVGAAAKAADRVCLLDSPPVQSCLRLGLPARTLYATDSRQGYKRIPASH